MNTIADQATLGASPVAAAFAGPRRKVVAAAMVGNVLEWYDFAIYAFYATTIARHFFPAGDDAAALLSTFLVFGGGFIVRPLGGLIIGRYGDRRGRKPALLLTIMLMAIGTGMIGLIPSYGTIGVAAPLLLVVARLLQGFSAGGEWGGSAVFLVEWAPQGRRGLFGGIHEISAVLGPLLSSGIAALLFTTLPADMMDSWGWRIPFLAGVLIGPVGLYIRRTVDETPAFAQKIEAKAAAVAEDWKSVWLRGVKAFAIVALIYATFYTLFFMVTFAQRYVGLTRAESLWANTVALLALALGVIAAAAASDYVGRKPLMLGACILLAIITYPLFLAMGEGSSFGRVLLLQVLFALCTAMFAGPFPATLAEIFPTRFRLTALAVAYNLSGIVFGGFNSYLSTWLIERSGSPAAAGLIVICAAVISGAGLCTVPETARKPLQ